MTPRQSAIVLLASIAVAACAEAADGTVTDNDTVRLQELLVTAPLLSLIHI